MRNRLFYFATPTDLKKIIETIDGETSYQYVEAKNFSVEEYESALHLQTLLDYPQIGYSKSGTCNTSIILLLPREQKLQLKRVSGGSAGSRIIVSQELNQPSVAWFLGGMWNEHILLKGEISTVHNDPATKDMMKQIQRCFAVHCSKNQGYYISPEVASLSDVRLITMVGETVPPEYDLHISSETP